MLLTGFKRSQTTRDYIATCLKVLHDVDVHKLRSGLVCIKQYQYGDL